MLDNNNFKYKIFMINKWQYLKELKDKKLDYFVSKYREIKYRRILILQTIINQIVTSLSRVYK